MATDPAREVLELQEQARRIVRGGGERAEPGFLRAIKQAPRGIFEILASGTPGAGPVRTRILNDMVLDIIKAKEGDEEAAARVGGRELATSIATSLIPGGAGLRGARLIGAGAAGGAAAGAIESVVGGRDPVEGALFGGVAGGVVPPAARAVLAPVGRAIGRRVAGRTARKAAESGAEVLEEPANNLDKLNRLIEEAEPALQQQTEARTVAVARKAAAVRGVREATTGEAGLFAELGKLKGKLPEEDIVRNPVFRSIRNAFTQTDIDELMNQVKHHGGLNADDVFEPIRGRLALHGLLEGELPTASELEILRKVFGSELIATILKKRDKIDQLIDKGIIAASATKALKASADLSAALRQGLFFITRPKQFSRAFAKQIRIAFAPDQFDAIQRDIVNDPAFPLMQRAGVEFTEIGGPIGLREDPFIGAEAVQSLPILGTMVRWSNRTYNGFLNELRREVFNDILKHHSRNAAKFAPDGRELVAEGVKVLAGDTRFLRSLGNFINEGTGRGRITAKGGLEKAAPALNALLFSPRLMMSRARLLTNFANPFWWRRTDPRIRREYFKSMMSNAILGGTLMGTYALAKRLNPDLAVEIEPDPRSSDFGKVRIGPTRFDVYGGFQQFVRTAAVFMTGEKKSPVTGKIRPKKRVSEVLFGLERGDFIRNKLAPVPSMLFDLIERGNDFGGEPITVTSELRELVTPLIIDDLLESIDEWGLETGTAVTVPAFFGVGVQTFPAPGSNLTEVQREVLELQEQTKRIIGGQ